MDGIALPCSILDLYPQRGQLLCVRIPALDCFAGCIDGCLNCLWPFCRNRLDQPLFVGRLCLRPFVSSDQFSVGCRLIHGGLFSKTLLSGVARKNCNEVEGNGEIVIDQARGVNSSGIDIKPRKHPKIFKPTATH